MAFKESDNGGHGSHVDHPAKKTVKGWRDIMLRMKDQMEANHLSITSAGIAYFAFLAIFPGLAALVSLYGLNAEMEHQTAADSTKGTPNPNQIKGDRS